MQHLALECAVRAALIAAGTAAALRLLRVKTAAARHLAWAGVVVLMMMLPIWTAWGPKASLRVLPAVPAPAASRSMVPASLSAPAPRQAAHVEIGGTPAPHPAWSAWYSLTGIYLLGVCVLLARLAVGMTRAHLLVRRAAIREGQLTSSSCAAPVTVGWLRPTVILPECWPQWPRAQLDAVLTHEHEHVRRRDPLVQCLALLNRAIFWFHPLSWWLERRLSGLAEEACDAAVLARGHDPFQYSEYLLEIARSVLRTGARVNILGMAMPGSFLPARIHRILAGGPAPRVSRVRMASLAVICAAVSAVFAAGAVDRRKSEWAPAPVVRVEAPAAQQPPAPEPLNPHPMPARPAALLAQVQAAPAAPAPAAVTATAPQNDPRMLVLYFDLRAMPIVDRARSFAAAQEVIRTRTQSGDLLAIMTASDSVRVMQDFTDDRDRLLQIVDHLIADSGPESSATVDVDLQLTGLQTAVGMLASLKGKKALVYFAEPVERTESAQLRSLIDAAIRANVAFFAVDPRGLTATGGGVEAALVPKAYVIGAGDVIQISVVQQQAVSGQYTVRADGMISVPQIGDIRAAGLTTFQLEAVIGDRLEARGIVSHPAVRVSATAAHGRMPQNPQ